MRDTRESIVLVRDRVTIRICVVLEAIEKIVCICAYAIARISWSMEIGRSGETTESVIAPATDIIIRIGHLCRTLESIICISRDNILVIYLLDICSQIIISIIEEFCHISESIRDDFFSWGI